MWQNAGWNSIIYIAALAAIDPQLHEAAQIDGASRLQRIDVYKRQILDEPTNHLDVKYQLQLLNTVKSLDLTAVSYTHLAFLKQTHPDAGTGCVCFRSAAWCFHSPIPYRSFRNIFSVHVSSVTDEEAVNLFLDNPALASVCLLYTSICWAKWRSSKAFLISIISKR